MGLAVVATSVPGCIDSVVHGETGTLVPPRDAEALREALHAYLTDEHLRMEHGRKSRERVLRDYQPEAIWGALYDQYCELAHPAVAGMRRLSRIGETA
jgi:glycosyltransferase involved in cell wall biosynthesis